MRTMERTANAGQIGVTMAMPLVVPRAGWVTKCAKGLGPRFMLYVRRILLAQRARAELHALSDVELRDIGLTRTDINAVATGAFTR
jgi:uncharacterized protein YjiS (DUF1127 family)